MKIINKAALTYVDTDEDETSLDATIDTPPPGGLGSHLLSRGAATGNRSELIDEVSHAQVAEEKLRLYIVHFHCFVFYTIPTELNGVIL